MRPLPAVPAELSRRLREEALRAVRKERGAARHAAKSRGLIRIAEAAAEHAASKVFEDW